MLPGPDPTRPRPRKRVALLIAAIAVLLVLGVYGSALFVLSLFQGQPFASVDELNPAEVKSLQVRLLNRKELDGGEDVGPYYAKEEDYEKLLAPLKGAREVDQFPDARGPLLGEYRVQLKSGRKGTIRLYWSPRPGGKADAPPPARLRFQIGDHKFEDGNAEAVVKAAEECETRGRSGR